MSNEEDQHIDCAVSLFHAWFFSNVDQANDAKFFMTNGAIATKAGISQAYYSEIRNGKRPLSLKAIYKIAWAVELDLKLQIITNDKDETQRLSD